MPSIIQLNNVTKKINDKIILNNINIKIPRGQITVLLGPNGSGKTTTLKVMSNLVSYNDGNILLADDVEDNQIVYLFDEPILYEELTGFEHIRFLEALFDISLNPKELNDYIDLFSLEDYMDHPIFTYSLGTKKKVQLLCSLLKKPKVILLDEYISGLDPTTLYNVKKILRELVDKGSTVVLATHMLDVAEKFCDEFILIHNGSVNHKSISLDSLKTNYSSLEAFFIRNV